MHLLIQSYFTSYGSSNTETVLKLAGSATPTLPLEITIIT